MLEKKDQTWYSEEDMNNKKFFGIALISFIFGMAGIVISALLLKEDVLSTAHTVFEYFPSRYGVTPSTTWGGAKILGVFISVLQVVSASVAFSNKFSMSWRILATASLGLSVWFDNWTDVIFRSGYGVGDRQIAMISTMAFYTFGSEITQSLSWLVIMSSWRAAISDGLIGMARIKAGLSSIKGEWSKAKGDAYRSEFSNYPKDEKSNQQNKPEQKHESHKPVAALDKNRYHRGGLFTIHKK